MSHARRFALAGLMVVAACKTGGTPSTGHTPPTLVFLGALELPPTRALDAPVGGLSALAYDATLDVLWALSDDRSERGPARIHAFRVHHQDARPTGLDLLRTLPLLDAQGHPFERHTLDPEGLTLAGPDHFLLSSEGITSKGIPPFVVKLDRNNAAVVETLVLPDAFIPDAPMPNQTRGVLDNFGLEALGTCPDQTALTMNEAPLAQDRPRGNVLRVLVFPPAAAAPPSQWEYVLEPAPPGSLVHGVTSLLCLEKQDVLTLERSWGKEVGFFNRIFHVDFSQTPARKTLVLDLNTLALRRDNYEGLSLGPTLPDGRRTLYVVSDDNFLAEQATVLAWFAFSPLKH